VVVGARPDTPIFQSPPLLAIEILSLEDRPARFDRTIGEWLASGVAYVCVIAPETPIEIPLHKLYED
jgi:Uma2 family endonuclease